MLVTDELHAYLIAQGIGLHPNDVQPYMRGDTAPADVSKPSIWKMPRDGYPVPRRNRADVLLEPATITLVATNLAPPSDLGDFIEVAFIDVIVRSWHDNSLAMFLQRTIRTLLTDANAVGGKKFWMMNDLLVEYSTQWRGDQALAEDADTYLRSQAFQIAARRKALAGLPYVP
jgi:hypothetical protein